MEPNPNPEAPRCDPDILASGMTIRQRMAAAVATGYPHSYSNGSERPPGVWAMSVVSFADALIAKLNREPAGSEAPAKD